MNTPLVPIAYLSCAIWPQGTVSELGDITTDKHETHDQAVAVCQQLLDHGFGGQKQIFPRHTYVEPVFPENRLNIQPLPLEGRDENGMWFHPGIPWDLVPEDTSLAPYLKAWGFAFKFDELESEDSEAHARYFNADDDPDFSFWNPEPPEGEGWFLGAMFDTEDGPCAVWIKPLPPKP